MNWPEMEIGDSIAGLLVDGVEDTPYVGATLRMADSRGVVVEVPYLSQHEAAQFANVDAWFAEQSPPTNLLMRTPKGSLSMFDVAWSGHSETWGGSKASLGKFRPHEVVFARREGDLADPLTVDEVHSQIDGLSRWTRETAITTDTESDENNRVQSVTIRMTGGTFAVWQQGDSSLELRSHWTHNPVRDGVSNVITLHDTVTLVTSFGSDTRSFWEHFVEQRKVANLVTFVFGRAISFRRHQIRDERFPARYGGSGEVYELPLRELLSRNTYRERARPVPTADELGRPLVPFAEIGAEGLRTWSEAYDRWARFILPSLGVLSRREAFIEDVVLSTSMSLEAAGGLLGEREGESTTYWRARPTTATYAYRCIHELGLTWPTQITSITGLARAIANNYNDLKHADRGELPDHSVTFLVGQVNRFIVRSLALGLSKPSGELREVIQRSTDMSELGAMFHYEGLSIRENGTWVAVSGEVGDASPVETD